RRKTNATLLSTMPTGDDIVSFFQTPWGIAWLAVLGGLLYGWYRMKSYFPLSSSPARTFSQGDLLTSSTSMRRVALALYAAGAAVTLFAFPFLATHLASEQSDGTGAVVLTVVGLADVIAGIIVLRNARCRHDMAAVRF
ncbi:MAG: hypothetical protein AB7V39_25810, partial [Nitrospiraceae bacterium]